ncbi:MAG: dTMP kinase [Dehalococcoidia bacterium]|nr:dTMP kinase [Dehalococcoidia bacterium]
MSVFITFEGGEGSGKSSQARALYRTLLRQSISVILIHEPGSTPLGEKLSRLLKHHRDIQISPISELLLFNAARAQLVSEVIRPALEKGTVVICDRFTDSTIAYQGSGRGLDIKRVVAVNDTATGGLKPHLTVLLDIPVEEGLKRKQGKHIDRFELENIAFHDKVRQGYLALAKREPRRFLVVDARRDRQTIAGIIQQQVGRLLKKWMP